jgi:uncharacterized membrane protein
MKEACRGALVGLTILGLSVFLHATVFAEVTFEVIGVGSATDISADGTVVVGNTVGDFETFRWTAETGIVRLGRASVPVLGVGAGGPDVSADGSRVSATILGADSTYVTQGVWTEGAGWQETMPPLPPDGGLIDNAYGSAWGLSDDGQTLTGLYWRPGHGGPGGDGLAHASAWTEPTGVVDLGSGGGNSRANDASFDGSVIVGWDENPSFGTWWPTVWVDGVRTVLTETEAFSQASAVTPDGSMIGGQSYDAPVLLSVAAVWRWNGSTWNEQQLGALPGTSHSAFGLAIVRDMTADGSMVVGYNQFSNPSDATGFMWTEETGLVDVEDFLVDNGVVLDPMLNILTLTGVSDDGTTMVGIGQDVFFPFSNRSFIIRIGGTVSVAETAPSPPLLLARVLPNPTSGATTVAIDLPQSAQVAVNVYDSTGRLVHRLLPTRSLQAGRHEFRWDGTSASGGAVPSGVYYYRIKAGTRLETMRVTILH